MSEEEKRIFEIGDGQYFLVKKLWWKQVKWLGESVLKGVDLNRLDFATAHDINREHAPLAMAICLVDVGMDERQHCLLSWNAILSRAQEFGAVLAPEMAVSFTLPFFQLLRPASVIQLTPGKVMEKMFVDLSAQSPAPSMNGSSAASSPSPGETSPSSESSLQTSDLLIQIHTSVDASSERPLTEPSLVSAESHSPG